MSETVTLKINGNDVTVPAGTNLIDAADAAGVHIPNLCYLKGSRGVGACRLCLVEVEGGRGPAVGCITKAKEGMVVNTNPENLVEIRKFIVDLIVSMHPMDCMTCTKAGACTLQEYAFEYGVKESSYTRKSFNFAVDEANPFIKRDPDYCVLCGRCVRACKEQGTEVLEFMSRGVGSKVSTAMDKPLQDSNCTFCGTCVDVCPVNALTEASTTCRDWELTKNNSVCLSCGSGCDITVSAKDGLVVKVNANADDGSVEKYTCAIGRFGLDALTSDARVTTPLKNNGGKFEEISWDEAIKTVADKLKEAGANAGIISSANILNEDAAALAKLASDAVKTQNIDSSASLYADADSLLNSDSVNIDDADAIILAGLNPSQQDRLIPALSAAVRRKASRGAKLIVVSDNDSEASASAHSSIKGDEAQGLAQIAKGLIDAGSKNSDVESAVSGVSVSEDAAKAVELLGKASSPLVICSPALFGAARNLSLLGDYKVVAVPLEANARGVAASISASGKSFSEMADGGVDVLFAVGDLPASVKKAGFTVAQTSFLTGLAKDADIVLPAAAPAESSGSITNYLGKTKTLDQCLAPAGDSKQNKEIIVAISEAMGSAVSADASAAPESAAASFSPFEKKAGLDADTASMRETSCDALLNKSRLLWLKEGASV